MSRRGRFGVRVLAVVLIVAAVTGTGVYLWARTATDTSQFARALLWGDSGFGDQDQFPYRTMAAAAEPVQFNSATQSPLADLVEGPDGQPLEQLLESTKTTAFIVLHGDDLLYESYFNGSSKQSSQTSFSVAKSFVATLVGIAIQEELFSDLGDPITAYIPELSDRDSRFGEITLGHLIVMSSGLSFEHGSSPWADPANTYYGTDLRSLAVNKPRIVKPPGLSFDYNDWNVILLGLALERASGMSVAEYAETRLWQPMGAEADGSWSLDSEQYGFEKMFVGVNARAIDFAKLGWLYLNDGRNGAEQVVSADFIKDATSLDAERDPSAEYQYLWWIDEGRDAFYANGDHGQFIYVSPGHDVVIVRHGYTPGDFNWIQFFGDLAERIGAHG